MGWLACEDSPVHELLGFSADQASHLTGLSNRQLRYWDDTEFFAPALRDEVERAPWSRVYSFRDIVGLRAIAEMRQEHHIPLQRLRRVGAHLREHYEDPWSTLIFYIVDKHVYFRDAKDAAAEPADHTGQQVMSFMLVRVEGEVRRKLAEMRKRGPDQVGKISQNRHVAENQAVLRGTRIPTIAIWEYHQAGRSKQDILRSYPQLSEADIDAALLHETKRASERKTRHKKAS
jgi:uncharacterized protein (DUF433 family)